MLILPAIDLLNGNAVRLKQGVEGTAKIYSTHPPEMAEKWRRAGAEYIHIVNLDGAFGRSERNVQVIRDIVDQVDIPIELGGGIRTVDDAQRWIDAGVDRVIFGTIAVTHPKVIGDSIAALGADRVVIGIDARHDKVAIKGWREETDMSLLDLAHNMKAIGVKRIVYTDVQRDGELIGPNISRTGELASELEVLIIASGGFSHYDHFKDLQSLDNSWIEGVIVGTALYEGVLELPTLIRLVKPPTPSTFQPE